MKYYIVTYWAATDYEKLGLPYLVHECTFDNDLKRLICACQTEKEAQLIVKLLKLKDILGELS